MSLFNYQWPEEFKVNIANLSSKTLSDLLVKASDRTQLIVTTHSDVLVDALNDNPQSIVICEKNNGQTEMRRLDKEEIGKWLEEYRLGDLWTSGELGGNRW